MLSTEAAVVQRISAVGILADVGFGCTKLGVGTACASPALVADGAHSLADVLVGACAASASVCLMIPLDTVKVRMTTGNLGGVAYRNVADAIRTMLREEGAFCFYRGLPPRLLSVVPMIAIQFANS